MAADEAIAVDIVDAVNTAVVKDAASTDEVAAVGTVIVTAGESESADESVTAIGFSLVSRPMGKVKAEVIVAMLQPMPPTLVLLHRNSTLPLTS